MSTDHRKPVMAFVVLALMAGCLVGVQRAEAQSGRLLAAAVGLSVRAQGALPDPLASLGDVAQEQATTLGPLFALVLDLPSGAASDVDAAEGPASASDPAGRAPRSSPSPGDRDDAKVGESTSRPVVDRGKAVERRGEVGATAERGAEARGRGWHGGRAGARSRGRAGGSEGRAQQKAEHRASRHAANLAQGVKRAEQRAKWRADKAVRHLERARQKAERRAVRAAHVLARTGDTARGPSKSSRRNARFHARGTGLRHQAGRSGRAGRPGGAGRPGQALRWVR